MDSWDLMIPSNDLGISEAGHVAGPNQYIIKHHKYYQYMATGKWHLSRSAKDSFLMKSNYV